MKPRISLLTLGVSDFHRSLAFYRDGLGLPTHNYRDGDEIVFFALEGTWLALFPKAALAADATVPAAGSGFTGITIAHNVASQAEVNETFALAISAGAKLIKTPEAASWGGYSGYFADPDGYLWEVAYNPFLDLT